MTPAADYAPRPIRSIALWNVGRMRLKVYSIAHARSLACNKDRNTVCVWDLVVQSFERQAWIECVIGNPNGPDVAGYLARQFNGAA